jgi:hypothetical protein
LLFNINKCLLLITLSTLVGNAQQIGNYVGNGSFEDLYGCTQSSYNLGWVKSWTPVDSLNGYGGIFCNTCNLAVPLNGNTYQYARTGNSYILATMFDDSFNGPRGFLKNRLKHTLTLGRTYCVKFYVNIANTSPRGMNGFGAFFGGDTLQLITTQTELLSYADPQISNPTNNVISDTLNWVPITGTFVANGTEKFVVIGNYLADDDVITSPIYTPYYPEKWTDVCIDDVSCIEVDLPAYAGPDLSIAPGDSTFIGRQSDFAIDPGCRWFQLPAMTPLDTTSGIWVKPIVTTTYVVRQELDCSTEKWDTVVVHMNLVGLSDFGELNRSVVIYPSPAHDHLMVTFRNTTDKVFSRYTLIDHLGRAIREEELIFDSNSTKIDTRDLSPGVYLIQLQTFNSEIVSKRFVIAR